MVAAFIAYGQLFVRPIAPVSISTFRVSLSLASPASSPGWVASSHRHCVSCNEEAPSVPAEHEHR